MIFLVEMAAIFTFRNELRRANGVAAAWGNGEQNDWALAAERAGNLILGE